jgi:hypothetical protein
VVRKAPTSIVIEPVGDIGPGPWDGSGPLAGTFVLRGTDRTWARTAPVMEFLGMVRRADDQLAWRVSDLIPLAPADGPDGFLVAGWMVRTPFHPCPSPANPYDCPTSDLLTPERVQPTHADGSFELPEIALALPSGTYDEFAPDPAPEGPGVVPRPGYFLLQRVSIPPCGLYAWDVAGATPPPTFRAPDPIEARHHRSRAGRRRRPLPGGILARSTASRCSSA